MKIQFRGVRGSIPSPGHQTVRYGGNTTCIEIWSDDGELIILDAGTGIFPLAHSLLPRMPLHAHIFNSHTHWDHIQGLPFFIPLFVSGNQATIYGAYDPISGNGIEEILAVQMQYRFYPVRECELKANIRHVSLREGEQVHIGEVTVTPVLMNHSVLNFGYRIDCRGKSLFFTGDHEIPYNIYAPEDDKFSMYQSLVDQKEQSILSAIQGVDVLIADASYSTDEYPDKKGWGHGTHHSAMLMAERISAQQLFLTHHEPTRSDDALEDMFKTSMNEHKFDINEIDLAREGLCLEW